MAGVAVTVALDVCEAVVVVVVVLVSVIVSVTVIRVVVVPRSDDVAVVLVEFYGNVSIPFYV